VFLAGSTAFIITTTIIVIAGELLLTLVPVQWIRLVGGGVMIAYGLWEARGLVGQRLVEEESSKLQSRSGGWKAFFVMVGSLALLDLAGDATEILTILFVAHYANAPLVFAASCVGLVSATAIETALGSRLGRLLTPKRLRYIAIVVFLGIGASVILLNAI
ncbi:MAG: TMEM165/GDT1 family protein, partial [Thaumarchaeota archaeon]|nr:TMEM165/GDT1 family protein [Nitrososphaerota archaeon]